jgi:hypothetical protein
VPYWIDPITDSRWTEFIDSHPYSSVFHTTGWLRALQKTYDFAPSVITTSPPGTRLGNGIPFCFIKSFLTGQRLTSLPFSDHCQPLADPEALDSLIRALIEDRNREKYKYLELRPLKDISPTGFNASQKFLFHNLNLRPSIDKIFQNLHKDCVRRKIRRAKREGLTIEKGTSDKLVNAFFTLQLHTRRKHGLPPQPKQWFRNLVQAMEGAAVIRVVYRKGNPVASILTIRHKKTETYKYGCSEVEDNNLGGMQLLLWQAIEDAKDSGMVEMDLGRCDIGNKGLAVFKERWGAERQEIRYFRYPSGKTSARNLDPVFKIISRLPDPVLKLSGRILYRHFS